MLEMVALVCTLLSIGNMASERRLSVVLITLIGAAGWIAFAVVFRYLVPLGLVMALSPWFFLMALGAYVKLQKIPQRKRTYEGLEELSQSMAEAQAFRERQP
jgi:hypothetical protein